MKTESKSAAQSAITGKLESMMQLVMEKTGKTSREIALILGYKQQDYISIAMSKERKGHPIPSPLIKKINTHFKFELTGEKQISRTDEQYIEQIMQRLTEQAAFIRVLMKNVALLNSKLPTGLSYAAEERTIREDMAAEAVSQLREG